jgi:hypothetical protein
MTRPRKGGGRPEGSPVSGAKPRFCAATQAAGRMPGAAASNPPMEFAVEANRLMAVSLEGAVG